jgi:hypothetical protein
VSGDRDLAMRRIHLLSALLLLPMIAIVFAIRAFAADVDRCGGVLMAIRTVAMDDHRGLVRKLGFYSIDGGLLMNGETTCTSIHIECQKAGRTCRTATAVTTAAFGLGRVLGVFMSDDYTVTEWTNETISAELRQQLGDESHLHIAINHGVPDDVQIINVHKSLLTKPGEWTTEVLTIGNEPIIAKAIEKAGH